MMCLSHARGMCSLSHLGNLHGVVSPSPPFAVLSSSVVSVQSRGWLHLSQSQLTGCWIFSFQSGSQPIANTLESASQSLGDGLGCSTEKFLSCCWSDQMTRYRGRYNLINRCTFLLQKQGILAQQTPPFLTSAWRLLFWGTCSLIFGLKHYLVTHPSWNILYSTAKCVQAASLVSCQES